MAANCALFWTSNGWDGSEEMMLKSRAFCTRVPSLRRITFISISAATTLIVTIQGVQSVYSPVQGFFDGNYAVSLAFDSIFYSLAFLGLMRLPAALWLTEDYSYMDIDKAESTAGEEMDSVEMETVTTKPGSIRALSTTGLLAQDSGFLLNGNYQFRFHYYKVLKHSIWNTYYLEYSHTLLVSPRFTMVLLKSLVHSLPIYYRYPQST
jgi:hypothetical protein